jgi:hypothetical protein
MIPLMFLATSVMLLFAGFGAYRAWRYGNGARRYFAALPVALLVVGAFVLPLIIGVLRRAGVHASFAGISADELVIVAVMASLLFATVSGAILALVFRPPYR